MGKKNKVVKILAWIMDIVLVVLMVMVVIWVIIRKNGYLM